MKRGVVLGNKVISNLLQQDCYIHDFSRVTDVDFLPPDDLKYISLDEKVTPSGIKQEFNEYDYPITSAYVNSFVDSADYRKDPIGSIARSEKRQNLGDIVDFQEVANMDMEQARALYAELSKKIVSAQQEQQVQDQNVQSEVEGNVKK